MSLRNEKELATTQAKLRRLEARYEALRDDKREDQRVRELSMASLKETINLFKEEIAFYHAHRTEGK